MATWVGYDLYAVTGSYTYTEEGSYQPMATAVDSGGVTQPQLGPA